MPAVCPGGLQPSKGWQAQPWGGSAALPEQLEASMPPLPLLSLPSPLHLLNFLPLSLFSSCLSLFLSFDLSFFCISSNLFLFSFSFSLSFSFPFSLISSFLFSLLYVFLAFPPFPLSLYFTVPPFSLSLPLSFSPPTAPFGCSPQHSAGMPLPLHPPRDTAELRTGPWADSDSELIYQQQGALIEDLPPPCRHHRHCRPCRSTRRAVV